MKPYRYSRPLVSVYLSDKSKIQMHLRWGKRGPGKSLRPEFSDVHCIFAVRPRCGGQLRHAAVRSSCRDHQRRDSQDSLKIDDREVLKNYYVDIDAMHVVHGMAVAVGTSSAGGNACEGSPFVVSFPKGQNP